MLFRTIDEMRDINEYRNRAMNRKIAYYRDILHRKDYGIDMLEFELLECIERLRSIMDLPFVDVIEAGDGAVDRRKAELRPNASCKIAKEGHYLICCNWDMAIKLQREIVRIFGEPWSEQRIAREAKDGIEYRPYQKPVYDFPFFRKFSICKSELSQFVTKMAFWFVGLHELAHIKNGHLHYKADVLEHDREPDLDSFRALELHADITAAELLLQLIDGWKKYYEPGQWIVRGGNRDPHSTYSDEITFAAIGAYLSLRLFLKETYWDEYTIGLHEGSREDHPLTELRMAVVYNYFLRYVSTLGRNEAESIAIALEFMYAMSQFEDFMLQNVLPEGERSLQYQPLALLRTEEGSVYYHKLYSTMMRLNDTLAQYTQTPTDLNRQLFAYEALPERMFWEDAKGDFS